MDSMNMEGRLRSIFAAVFDIAGDDIVDADSPETIEKWDSVHHLQLIMAVESEFGIQFDADQIAELTNFAALKTHIQALLK
ncbi:MAG: acyl carrier protein [Desulfobacteraceae bacterium]|nr:MAG: acyl carrier protein [Desulfobacteraceae bacterium]